MTRKLLTTRSDLSSSSGKKRKVAMQKLADVPKKMAKTVEADNVRAAEGVPDQLREDLEKSKEPSAQWKRNSIDTSAEIVVDAQEALDNLIGSELSFKLKWKVATQGALDQLREDLKKKAKCL